MLLGHEAGNGGYRQAWSFGPLRLGSTQQNRLSGLMSGMWKRSMGKLPTPRYPKGPEPAGFPYTTAPHLDSPLRPGHWALWLPLSQTGGGATPAGGRLASRRVRRSGRQPRVPKMSRMRNCQVTTRSPDGRVVDGGGSSARCAMSMGGRW